MIQPQLCPIILELDFYSLHCAQSQVGCKFTIPGNVSVCWEENTSIVVFWLRLMCDSGDTDSLLFLCC